MSSTSALNSSSTFVLRDVPPPAVTPEPKGKGRRPSQTTEDRFWRHVDRSAGPEACWPYLIGTQGAGYGAFRWKDQDTGKWGSRSAHRVAWEFTYGEIPPGKLILHSRQCVDRRCCNPRHLRTGDHSENMADAAALKTMSAKKLNADKARKIVELKREYHPTNHALAERFGVTPGSISSILRGATWAKATGVDRGTVKMGRPPRLRLVVDNTADQSVLVASR